MARRISPKQLKALRDLIRGRRVLDVGHARSQFLGAEFSRYTQSWIVVGRPLPPEHAAEPPPNLGVVIETFDTWAECPPPTEFDVILFCFPATDHPQDAACVQWAAHPHVIIIFGHPTDDTLCGSEPFWELVKNLKPHSDERDQWSRMLVVHKPGEEDDEEEEEHHGHYPKKGERYKLANSFKWPGKKSGDKAPVVEIMKDWTKGSGNVKIVGKADFVHVRKTDLAAKM